MKKIVVRDYNEKKDREAVEELEKQCEFGSSGKPSLLTDLMGDPVFRVRNSPACIMLVAEHKEGDTTEIVGVVRGVLRMCQEEKEQSVMIFPCYRRLGLGTKLVSALEAWFKKNGVEYSYMATDCANQVSINLFTLKCDYVKFRTPTVLVQPVHAHKKPINSGIIVIQLSPQLPELICHRDFSEAEFSPKDIYVILCNKLSLGTYIALSQKSLAMWDSQSGNLPKKFAMLSVWNTKKVFKLQVKGVSVLTHACCVGSRMLDEWIPWLRIPSVPDLFSPFGVYSLYGLHMEGKGVSRLMKNLCSFIHNISRNDVGCCVIVAEVGRRDPYREAIPHWKRF